MTKGEQYLARWREIFDGNNFPDRSLDEWIQMFHEIYGDKNEGTHDFELLCRLVEELGELAEDMRKSCLYPRLNQKGEIEGILINIADATAWTAAFARRYGSLDEMVWHKYPARCSYCFAAKNCSCISNMNWLDSTKREARLAAYREKIELKPTTLYKWQLMFEKVFGNVNRIQGAVVVQFESPKRETISSVVHTWSVRPAAIAGVVR